MAVEKRIVEMKEEGKMGVTFKRDALDMIASFGAAKTMMEQAKSYAMSRGIKTIDSNVISAMLSEETPRSKRKLACKACEKPITMSEAEAFDGLCEACAHDVRVADALYGGLEWYR